MLGIGGDKGDRAAARGKRAARIRPVEAVTAECVGQPRDAAVEPDARDAGPPALGHQHQQSLAVRVPHRVRDGRVEPGGQHAVATAVGRGQVQPRRRPAAARRQVGADPRDRAAIGRRHRALVGAFVGKQPLRRRTIERQPPQVPSADRMIRVGIAVAVGDQAAAVAVECDLAERIVPRGHLPRGAAARRNDEHLLGTERQHAVIIGLPAQPIVHAQGFGPLRAARLFRRGAQLRRRAGYEADEGDHGPVG